MSAPPSNNPGGESARVRCLYCGGNNFPASAACWQCGRPLQAARTGPTPGGEAASNAAFPTSAMRPGGGVLPVRAESALAAKAAAALGLMFPYFGLPVGIVFLMLDDPRKTQLGWITIVWSIIGSVLNLIAFFITAGPLLWGALKGLAPHASGGAGLPGIPNLSGSGGLEMTLPLYFLTLAVRILLSL